MKNKTIKRIVSVVLALVIMLSLSCMAFAAEATETTTRNGNTLTGFVSYFAQESQYGAAGDMDVSATWTGSKVAAMYATAEVVDYVSGESLKKVSNNASNTTSVLATSYVGILNTRKVTVFGCGEIRDSFSLVVYPSISGTYGKSDGT